MIPVPLLQFEEKLQLGVMYPRPDILSLYLDNFILNVINL